MSFLSPLALLFGLLAVPILILYMLKLRRREVEVSSIMLWQMLLRDREANAPWQRLKRNLLLLLQLLLLAALVIALARPFLRVPTIATGTVVVLLDASASMNATDVEPNRFEAAKAMARQLIDGLSTDGKMSLLLVGHQPEVLASTTSDKGTLKAALGKAFVSEGPADWEAAFALASGTVRAASIEHSTVVIISDGGLPQNLPPLPGEVRYVPVGVSADNLAIEALALRPAPAGPELFAKVANHGDADRAAIISFYVGQQLFSAEQVNVPAGKSSDVVLTDLPKDPAIYRATLSLPASASGVKEVDKFPLDDTAWAVYRPPSAGRTLLISPGNVFLEQVLAALPGLQSFRLAAGAPMPADPFDLYVFDGVITDTLPVKDLLLINPPANVLFPVGEVFTDTALSKIVVDDPLTQDVDWNNVHILKARKVAVPAWARVLVEAEGGPLVFAGETGGRRVAVLTFDLHDSDLPLQVAYPILMSNLINYLAPAQAFSAPDGLRPGETLVVKPSGGDTVIAVEDPKGNRYAATATEAGVVFANTDVLGVYTVVSNQSVLGAFAVNLFNPAESNIRPAPAIRVGKSDVTASAREERGQLEIWPWLAAAAFTLLLVEWWIYHRGPTLPAVPGWRGIFRRKKMTS
jgi:aerotolerance regulator-like protein/VWA domain-containing protein